MQAVVSFNIDKGVPVITLSSEDEAEELNLNLLASSEDFKVVLEINDELVFKMGRRQDAADKR